MDLQYACTSCQGKISLTDYFCPTCGKKLKEKPLSTTIFRQIFLYLFSILLPPLGIWPAWKYLHAQDEKSKKIGVAMIILTLLSIVITLWITINFINTFNTEFTKQLNQYQGSQGLDF